MASCLGELFVPYALTLVDCQSVVHSAFTVSLFVPYALI